MYVINSLISRDAYIYKKLFMYLHIKSDFPSGSCKNIHHEYKYTHTNNIVYVNI